MVKRSFNRLTREPVIDVLVKPVIVLIELVERNVQNGTSHALRDSLGEWYFQELTLDRKPRD